MKEYILFKRFKNPAFLLFVLLLMASQLGGQALHVTGYADFEATLGNLGSDDSEFVFDNHHFNIVALGEIYTNVFANAEVEYEHAGEEIGLEYGYIGYTGFKNIRIMAGKFIVPFGRFNKDMHPTWINKIADRPHGFRNILPQTYSDVGIWVSGAIPLEGASRLTYDGFVVNGLMGEDGGDIRGMRNNYLEEYPDDGGIDDNKAIGGRFGLVLGAQGFDIAASIYSGRYSDNPDQELNLTLFGVDAAYHNGGFEVRAEYLHANQETGSEGDLKKSGGYAQMAYLINSKYEPVVRFSARSMPGEIQDQSRLSVGINYYISAASVVRLDYHINMEKSGFKSDNDVLMAQFSVSF